MPTPTIPGGHGLPPAPTIDSSTNCLIPFTPSAGTHIFRKLMFSEPEPFGTHFTSRPSQSGDELPVDDRQPVADVRAGVLARDRVHRVRAQRMLDRRARRAVAQRLVDARRMEREVLADAAGVDGDAGVLADEVSVAVGDLDVAEDRLEDALPGHGGLAARGVLQRVAEVLRDVLQRPDVEVRGGVLDGVLELGGGVDAHRLSATPSISSRRSAIPSGVALSKSAPACQASGQKRPSSAPSTTPERSQRSEAR